VDAGNPAWVPGDYRPAPGVTDEARDLLDAMRDFGEAFTARQAGEVAKSRDLMAAARSVLGHAGVALVLRLLDSGRIPYPDAPRWPVFLSELVRPEPGEPLYVALPPRQERPGDHPEAAPARPRSSPLPPDPPPPPPPPRERPGELDEPGALSESLRKMGLL
jgi:hypothetical protein